MGKTKEGLRARLRFLKVVCEKCNWNPRYWLDPASLGRELEISEEAALKTIRYWCREGHLDSRPDGQIRITKKGTGRVADEEVQKMFSGPYAAELRALFLAGGMNRHKRQYDLMALQEAAAKLGRSAPQVLELAFDRKVSIATLTISGLALFLGSKAIHPFMANPDAVMHVRDLELYPDPPYLKDAGVPSPPFMWPPEPESEVSIGTLRVLTGDVLRVKVEFEPMQQTETEKQPIESVALPTRPTLVLDEREGGESNRGVIARIVGHGCYEGVNKPIGRRQLFFICLLFKSQRTCQVEGREFTVVAEDEAAEMFLVWSNAGHLKFEGRDKTRPRDRVQKMWHEFIHQIEKEPRLKELFTDVQRDTQGHKLYAIGLRPSDMQILVSSIPALLSDPPA